MKQVVIAAILICSFSGFCLSAQGQFVESFENEGGLAYYQALGWNFYGASWDSTKQIEKKGSIQVIPATSTNNNAHSQSNIGQIATPTLSFSRDKPTKYSFSYKLPNSLNKNSARTFTMWLAATSTEPKIQLHTFNVLGDTAKPNTIYTSPTFAIPAGTSSRRLVIDFTGDGDGNAGMLFDNIAMDNATMAPTTLPIKLTRFNGALFNSKAELIWTVDTNEDGDYFEIEKSNNGKEFKAAVLLFTTSTNGTETYRYKESSPLSNTAYYRLKLVNKDKTFTYSNIVYLKKESAKNTNLKLASGTGKNTIQFLYSSASEEKSQVTVYNAAGTMVYSQTETLQKGINALSVPFNYTLIKGTYILEVKGATTRETLSFFKQ